MHGVSNHLYNFYFSKLFRVNDNKNHITEWTYEMYKQNNDTNFFEKICGIKITISRYLLQSNYVGSPHTAGGDISIVHSSCETQILE